MAAMILEALREVRAEYEMHGTIKLRLVNAAIKAAEADAATRERDARKLRRAIELARKVRAMEMSCEGRGLLDLSTVDLREVYRLARAILAE